MYLLTLTIPIRPTLLNRNFQLVRYVVYIMYTLYRIRSTMAQSNICNWQSLLLTLKLSISNEKIIAHLH